MSCFQLFNAIEENTNQNCGHKNVQIHDFAEKNWDNLCITRHPTCFSLFCINCQLTALINLLDARRALNQFTLRFAFISLCQHRVQCASVGAGDESTTRSHKIKLNSLRYVGRLTGDQLSDMNDPLDLSLLQLHSIFGQQNFN